MRASLATTGTAWALLAGLAAVFVQLAQAQGSSQALTLAIHPVLQLRHHDGLRRFRKLMEWRNPERPVEVTVRYVTRRGQWFGTSWKGDPARSGTIIFNIGIHLLDGLTWAIGTAPEVIRAHANPAGDQAEGRLQFGAVTVDWTLSTRETDLPPGTRAGAARYIAVDGCITRACIAVLYRSPTRGANLTNRSGHGRPGASLPTVA
jgi:predicted dehydrogenase